ncbi:hypothetical protein DV451_002856 [Geotrichum candidum]|uniref:[PSI+] induction protein 2 n=1 Tax=Geotrichum candidum TaxID=1173061 RepID=A0A0J9X900_GEOCN|nr:hypothetical protein DV451_002856 [Geotrichum candidum]KAI9212415.1 hypothetical protein DS838_002692 [Geotrichum bryndzae]KAF5105413.1 hypothetical protein DV453_004835 [Geotrichum candidum]KAF5112595.1 hypothetical protein DV452_003968 [Geotrichum candidum]KAF7497432.1 hypothetical protein DV113_004529 [Geotrichum candidum]
MIIPTQYLSSVLSAHPALTAPVCRLTSTFTTSGSAGLLGRRDLEQTATDLKSNWDSCMDKTVCKWVAIIGIILACLVLFWLITSIIRCLCLGVQCLEALFCCCRSCCTCCNCCGNNGRRSGNESYVVQHQNPAPVINNHYYDANNRAEPEYLTIQETAPPANAPPGYSWNGQHSGGYQKLNENTSVVEMNTLNNGGLGNPHASSALYSDTAYKPNQTTSYDNTYNSDYANMQGASHGSNAGYYNNRFN